MNHRHINLILITGLTNFSKKKKDLNIKVGLRAETLTNVFIRVQDSNVSSISHGSLEETVHQTFSSGDVLLIVRGITIKVSPSICFGLLGFIKISSHDLESTSAESPIAWARAHLLQATPKESRAWDWNSRAGTMQVQLQQDIYERDE